MKIINLKASNVKKLTAVNITPDGNIITLAGNNGAGKSSVLDSIVYALGGAATICEQPIRRGESNAEVVCSLEGGLTITRKFTGNGSTLKITTADGESQRSPQSILDSLVGTLSFDPLEFSRMKPEIQSQCLRQLAGLDFSELEREKARVYNARLLVGREVEVLKGKIEGRDFHSVPDAEIDLVKILAAKKIATDTNKVHEMDRRNLQTIQDEQNRDLSEKVRVTKEIRSLEEKLVLYQTELDKIEERLHRRSGEWKAQHEAVRNLKDEDVTVFDKQILEAAEVNEKIRKNAELSKQIEEHKVKLNQYWIFTEQIDAVEKEKERRLAGAKFPLPGLSFSSSGEVVYNGFPFKQCSDGEKLRVSVAVGMALNPKLKVIFIRDGSLLDTKGLQTVAELAEANNYQVWIEDARSVDPTAVIIEDGHVK